jgi:hypothetical protein
MILASRGLTRESGRSYPRRLDRWHFDFNIIAPFSAIYGVTPARACPVELFRIPDSGLG